jgi:hypothetical protein
MKLCRHFWITCEFTTRRPLCDLHARRREYRIIFVKPLQRWFTGRATLHGDNDAPVHQWQRQHADCRHCERGEHGKFAGTARNKTPYGPSTAMSCIKNRAQYRIFEQTKIVRKLVVGCGWSGKVN